MPRSITAFILALLLLPAAPAGDAWPHWRGPNRDGISPETDWSSLGAEQPLWKVNVGLGYSCVAISDGRVFTLGHDEQAGLDRLVCLDAKTGREGWHHEWPSEKLANFHGGGTLTTPSVDGDRVYVSTRFGRMMCLQTEDGAVRWERDLRGDHDIRMSFHGFSCSPLILGDRLLVALGDVLLCLDKATGEDRWSAGESGDGGYSNLVPFARDGREYVVVFAGKGPVVYDLADQSVRWTYPFRSTSGGVNAGTPILVDNEQLFISAAYNMGAALLHLGDSVDAEALWTSRTMRNKVSGCVLWEGHLYGFDESMLKCFDLEGNERWRVRGLGMGTPSIAGGRLLVLSSRGDLIVADANPDGFEPISRQRVLEDGVYWTPAVLVDGLIYCRNSLGDLVCLDHRRDAEAGGDATETAVTRLRSAEELFERHATLVGLDRRLEHSSLEIDGEIEILGAGITRTAMTTQRMTPNHWRLWYTLGRFGEVEHGYDGEVGWQLDPFYGNELFEGDRLDEAGRIHQFPEGVDARAGYTEVETTGVVAFADRDCYAVKARCRDGRPRTLYFDVDSGYLVGHEAPTEALTIYSDWRDFGDAKLPGRVARLIPDTGAEETVFVQSVTWDEVDPTVFERPATVRKMLRTPEEIEAANATLRERFGRHVGAYRADFPPYNGAPWRITIEGGDLVLSPGDMPAVALEEPREDGWFPLPYTDMAVRFLTDDGEPSRAMEFDRAGVLAELPRVEESTGG